MDRCKERALKDIWVTLQGIRYIYDAIIDGRLAAAPFLASLNYVSIRLEAAWQGSSDHSMVDEVTRASNPSRQRCQDQAGPYITTEGCEMTAARSKSVDDGKKARLFGPNDLRLPNQECGFMQRLATTMCRHILTNEICNKPSKEYGLLVLTIRQRTGCQDRGRVSISEHRCLGESLSDRFPTQYVRNSGER